MTHLSWQQIEEFTRELVEKIKSSGFSPDYLVGISVGGLIPLALLAQELDVNNVLTASASSYDDDKQRGALDIKYLPSKDLSGKKVLLIDEVTESGETLKQISQALIDQCHVNELKTAVLVVNKEKCKFLPDFYTMETDQWIVFPWEKGN